jgi:hypothetical protein
MLIIMALLACGSLKAQVFLKSYDYPPVNSRTDIGRSIETKHINGAGWSVAGFSNASPNAGGYDWFYQRLSFSGAVECTKFLGTPLDDSCFSHARVNVLDILGGFYRAPNSREKATISAIDTNCNLIYSRQITDTSRHQWRQVVNVPAGGFAATGFIETRIPGTTFIGNKIMAARYSPAGTPMWILKYMIPGTSVDEAYSICYQPSDSSFAITGRTNMLGADRIFILKVSGAGVPIWFKVYTSGSSPSEIAASRRIIALPGGNFAVTGWSNRSDPGSRDLLVFRVTGTGAVVWSSTYGAPGVPEEGHSLIFNSSDASLVFTGFRTPTGSANEDILLGKVTGAVPGTTVWLRSYPSTAGNDRGYDLEGYSVANAVGFAVTGQVVTSTGTPHDMFLMKTDAAGKITPGCLDTLPYSARPDQIRIDTNVVTPMQLQDTQFTPQVNSPAPTIKNLCVLTGINEIQNEIPKKYELKQNYPNPFNPSTNIQFSIPEAGIVTLTVYDNAGKEISTLVNGHKNIGSYIVSFDAKGLSSGIYYYKLTSGSFTEVRKMLLIK